MEEINVSIIANTLRRLLQPDLMLTVVDVKVSVSACFHFTIESSIRMNDIDEFSLKNYDNIIEWKFRTNGYNAKYVQNPLTHRCCPISNAAVPSQKRAVQDLNLEREQQEFIIFECNKYSPMAFSRVKNLLFDRISLLTSSRQHCLEEMRWEKCANKIAHYPTERKNR